MNNVHLDILGSNPFVSILNELEFNNILKDKPVLLNARQKPLMTTGY